MTRICSLAVALVLMIGHSVTVVAAEPLEYLSNEADVVIRLKAPEKTIAKVIEFADAVQPGAGEMVRQTARGLEQAIFVPGLAGVDRSRDWYIALFSRGRARPDAVFAIPATNAEQLTAVLPDRMTAEAQEDWVLYTDSADGVPAAAEPGAGISSVLQGELAAVFNRGDVSLFVNVDHLTDVYEGDIEAGRQQITQVLEQSAAAGAPANGMTRAAIVEMYGTMIDGVLQALDDAGGCSVGVTISAEGLGIEEYVTFADDSVTSQSLAAQPTSAMDSLAKLPSDAVGYFGFSGDMQRFMEWSWSLNASMLSDNPEQKAKFKKAMEAWSEVDLGDVVGSLSLETAADGILQYTAIAQATPIATVRQNMRKVTEIMGTIEMYGMKQEMTVQPDAETIGTHKIDLMTVKQEFDAELDPTGMQQRMQQILFGPNGIESRVAYLDDAYVMAMGGGRRAMQALLKSYDAAPNRGLDRYRTGLIGEPNILVLVDLTSLAVKGLAAAAEVPNLPIRIDAEALAQMPIDVSYVGVSLAGEANALRVKTVIPVEQLRGVMSLVGFFQQRR